MPINARTKGQTGEREVADLLNTIVFEATGAYGDFKRNLAQTQDGGFDLFSVDYPYFAFEVKRVEALSPTVIEKFWAQTLRQSNQPVPMNPTRNLLPVLIYRKNRTAWRVRTWGNLTYSTTAIVVDVSLDDFTPWFRQQIALIFTNKR